MGTAILVIYLFPDFLDKFKLDHLNRKIISNSNRFKKFIKIEVKMYNKSKKL